MTTDVNDVLMGSGAKYFGFPKVGTSIKGTIVRAEVQQQTAIDDKSKLLTWADGNPRLMVRLVIATDMHEDEDDNGERSVYLKGGLLKSVQDAVRKSGAKGLETGGVIGIKYVKDGEKTNKAFNAPKVYAAKYEAPDPMAVAAASEPASAPAEESLEDF